jgi:hypothetical protein
VTAVENPAIGRTPRGNKKVKDEQLGKSVKSRGTLSRLMQSDPAHR